MAETKILNTFIQLRNDSKANWESKNPVLLKGELGIELGSTGSQHKFKIGDGITQWTQLEYTYDFAAIMAAVDEKLANVGSKMAVYEASVENGGDKIAALQLVATEPNQGDIGIVSEDIAGGAEKQLTAYVYNGSVWKALDGNYNAENVYFDKDMTITANIGVQTIGDSGSKTLSTRGKNVQQVFDMIVAQEKNPTVTQPSTSVTLTSAGAKEVGTKYTPNWSVDFNPGSYQYGPATGVTATAYAVTDTNSGSASTQTGSFTNFTVGDDTNYKVSVTTTHTAGVIPKTNLNNDYAAGQIKAGSKTASSGAVTGFRSMFAGAVVTPITIDSDSIRALTGKKGQFAKTFSLTIPEGCKQVVIALPNGHTLTKVLDVGAFGTDIVGSFQLQTAQVKGLNNYTAAEYNVYVYAPDAALGSNTYNVTCA